jgi:hypothetical protein
MDLLGDGVAHRPDELRELLYDSEGGSRTHVNTHIYRIRIKLREANYPLDILLQYSPRNGKLGRVIHYRLARLITREEIAGYV